jgi:hypothetical protein
LNAYKYLALRFSLVALMPAIIYAWTMDIATGCKVYVAVSLVGHTAFAWIFRQEIVKAWKSRHDR